MTPFNDQKGVLQLQVTVRYPKSVTIVYGTNHLHRKELNGPTSHIDHRFLQRSESFSWNFVPIVVCVSRVCMRHRCMFVSTFISRSKGNSDKIQHPFLRHKSPNGPTSHIDHRFLQRSESISWNFVPIVVCESRVCMRHRCTVIHTFIHHVYLQIHSENTTRALSFSAEEISCSQYVTIIGESTFALANGFLGE
jgi:hypothetical protein